MEIICETCNKKIENLSQGTIYYISESNPNKPVKAHIVHRGKDSPTYPKLCIYDERKLPKEQIQGTLDLDHIKENSLDDLVKLNEITAEDAERFKKY